MRYPQVAVALDNEKLSDCGGDQHDSGESQGSSAGDVNPVAFESPQRAPKQKVTAGALNEEWQSGGTEAVLRAVQKPVPLPRGSQILYLARQNAGAT